MFFSASLLLFWPPSSFSCSYGFLKVSCAGGRDAGSDFGLSQQKQVRLAKRVMANGQLVRSNANPTKSLFSFLISGIVLQIPTYSGFLANLNFFSSFSLFLGFPRLSSVFLGFPRSSSVLLGSPRFSSVLLGSPRFSRFSSVLLGASSVLPRCFLCASSVLLGSPRFSSVLPGSVCSFLGISRGFCKVFVFFSMILHICSKLGKILRKLAVSAFSTAFTYVMIQ